MQKEADHLIIRDFHPTDLSRVSNIIAESFKEKFQKLSNFSVQQLPNVLQETGLIYSTFFPGYLVAEQNNEICGVMVLKWKNQNRPPNKYRFHVGKTYGYWKIIKLFLGLWLLTHKPNQGECYIEHIAVKPAFRGQKIGSKLILFGKNFAKENMFQHLSLFVSSKNNDAIRLYKKLGFNIIKIEKSFLTKTLFGIKQWYHMKQSLK